MTTQTRTVKKPRNFELTAWKWMRYSSIALIPLVWIHVLLKDVVEGVHQIANTPGGAHLYVLERWANPVWITYDILLLAFAFAHGMNGLRNVVNDFIHDPKTQRIVGWFIFIFWLVVSIIGGGAIVAAAASQLANS